MAKKMAIFLLLLASLGATSAGAYYVKKDYWPIFSKAVGALAVNLALPKSAPAAPVTVSKSSSDAVAKKTEIAVAPPSKEAKDQVASSPPKQNVAAKPATAKTTTNPDGSKTVTVAEGAVAQNSLSRVAALPDNVSDNPYGVKFTDQVGQYAFLEPILKDYLNGTLKWGSEISSLKEITIEDAGDTGWSGQYGGSYSVSESGTITSAFGSIILNVYYYKNSTFINDYMKVVLSHEYGHHYTLYHKWVDANLPNGTRFPDSYYTTRPLSKTSTVTDCAVSWGSCESEIIAEDYSYTYSGYGYHAMKDTVGLPAEPAMRSWFDNITESLKSMTTVTSPVVVPNQPPTVTITSPKTDSDVGSSFVFSADATDDKAVTKVVFDRDGETLAEDTSSPYQTDVDMSKLAPGNYKFTVKAYDGDGASAQQSFNLTISAPPVQSSTTTVPETGATTPDTSATSPTVDSAPAGEPTVDTVLPTVQFTKPAENPTNWQEGNLVIIAAASDDVAVTKIELYINDTLVATESSGAMQRIWRPGNVAPGNYIVKAKAYDAAGNTGEASITVVRS